MSFEPNKLPCLVLLVDPLGSLELYNQGVGAYLNPFGGGPLVGNDILCSKENADALAAKVAAETGLQVAAQLPDMGKFAYLPISAPGTAIYGFDVDQYELVNTSIPAGNLGSAMGNIEQLINEASRYPSGHFVFTDKYLNPADGKPTRITFKNATLQYLWI